MKKNILIATGGSGGHMMPALVMYDHLKKEYEKNNIQTFNLTKDLQKTAKIYLDNKKLIFWKDDTHWNELGIKLAMQILNSEIN